MAFCDAERGAAFPEISYGFYPVYADLYHVPCIQMPLKEDFSVDYRDYCGIGKMVVIAHPNAPTGMEISISEIEEILRSNPQNVVLIDEAYVDFGGTSCVELTKNTKTCWWCRRFQNRALSQGQGWALPSRTKG